MKKKNATAYCDGTIISSRRKGDNWPTLAIVKYVVNGEEYQLKETLKVKKTAIRLGPIPIGQKTTFVIGEGTVGSIVRVCYNPDNPANAYLPDNKGILNV